MFIIFCIYARKMSVRGTVAWIQVVLWINGENQPYSM